jgi:glucose/arabinose dehydrogenase
MTPKAVDEQTKDCRGSCDIPLRRRCRRQLPDARVAPPENPSQKPAFEGQTRACAVKSSVAFQVTVLARGLEHPWSVEPLPDGSFLVTERPGRMRIVSADGKLGEPLAGCRASMRAARAGCSTWRWAPTFENDRTIYWSFSEPREGGNATSVARGVALEGLALARAGARDLPRQPTYDGTLHFGSRLAFAQDGMLHITLAIVPTATCARRRRRWTATWEDPAHHAPRAGPRLATPSSARRGALPEIWSLGHRNVQAAAFDAQGASGSSSTARAVATS